MITKKNAENAEIFVCEKCDFKCSKKSNYVKHLTTRKHINDYISLQNLEQKMPKQKNTTKNICVCGREYVHRQGLYAHKKKCDRDEIKPAEIKPADNKFVNIILKDNFDFKTLILEVVKNNSELQKQTNDLQKANLDLQAQMLAVCQTSSNNTNINSNNKTFNLQVFLNEQCKDAMNLMDFVDSFKLQFDDLEQVGELGYVEGLTNIIMKKLNEM